MGAVVAELDQLTAALRQTLEVGQERPRGGLGGDQVTPLARATCTASIRALVVTAMGETYEVVTGTEVVAASPSPIPFFGSGFGL